MNHNTLYDVIVIGAGTMGMATGAFLAKANAKTLLLDAFNPPHNYGSHHGETRMIRHAYGEGRQYVSLVKRAQELWDELEHESNYRIFEKTGVLGMAKKGSPFITETIEAAKRHDLPLKIMSAAEVMKKWPGIKIPKDYIGCLEPDSGFLHSENCINAYKDIALEYGAEILPYSPVLEVEHAIDRIKVRTADKTFIAKKVIVTMGASTPKFLKSLNLPIQPIRKVFGWFETEEKLYNSSKFPSFYLDEGDRMFYGFPNINGTGLKLGRTDGGQPIVPDQHKQNFGAYDEDEGELREFLKSYMPQANGDLIQGKTCLQSRSSDSHFIIDYHPDSNDIIFASGFSGHGFKFASVIGEALSQLITQGHTEHDLSLFSLSRFNNKS